MQGFRPNSIPIQDSLEKYSKNNTMQLEYKSYISFGSQHFGATNTKRIIEYLENS